MRADSSEPTAEAPNVPEFTSEDLHERLDGVLGKGVTSTVYSLEGYPGLAVKEIQLSGLSTVSVDAIKLELATVPGISHPGIVKYHQVIWDEDLVYIVMDRHDKTLEDLVKEHKRRKLPVSIELVLSAVRQIAAALAYLHSVSGVGAAGAPFRGLVHRDLKPANVLVSADGEHFVIADFGLCKDALRSGSTFAGTRPYMAPETLVRNKTSPASDVWSLGVILYELTTLKRPDFLKGREPKDVFVDGWRPDLSGVTDGFIRHVLEKIFVLDPTERPTARELSELLQASNASPRELSDNCKALTADVGALKEALAHTSSRNEALEKTVAALKGDLEAKSVKMAAFEKELASKTEEIASLKGTVAAQATDIGGLKKDADAKSSKISALEKALASKTEEIASLRKDLEAKTAKIATLEDQCREHLAATKALEDKVMQLSDAVATTSFHELLLLPRLLRAAHMNNTETIRMLLEEGVRTGQRDEQGMTALMHAAQQGHAGPVELLAEKEKGLQDKNGWTALMHAVQKGSLEVIKILLEHEKGMRDKQDHNALYHALKTGRPEAAKVIIPYEDPTDEDGVTALMRAAARGDTKTAELLVPVQKGLKDKDGNTAFMHALKNKHTDIAALLREHEASSWTPLMHAAATGDIEGVKKHLSDKDKKNNDGETALIIAAKTRRNDVVELLDPTDRNGFTALMRAAERNDPAAAEALLPLQGGMRTTRMVEIDGWPISSKGTALMLAAVRGHTEVARLLVEKEGGMSDSGGYTALMAAAVRGRTGVARLLVEREGRMSDSIGRTALMLAAENGHTDCARLLLEREKDMRSKWGDTALSIAKEHNRPSIVSLLSE